jgi:hypothetical protein
LVGVLTALCAADISIPPDHDVPSEDDEVEQNTEGKKNTDKWSDLGLNQLENA